MTCRNPTLRPSRFPSLVLVTSIVAAAGVSMPGCDRADTDTGTGDGLTVRLAALAPGCKPNENQDGRFPSDADSVALELSGGTLSSPVTFFASRDEASDDGRVIVTGVPPGENMTLRIAACQAGGATWAGRVDAVDVRAHEKSFPAVFLTPVDQLACVGGAASQEEQTAISGGSAFAATVGDASGALIIGGLNTYTVATKSAVARAGVDRYTRATGEFSTAGSLLQPRALATAQQLSNGQVRVFGGVTRLAFAEIGKPALSATAADAPEKASELFDPTTGTSSVEFDVQIAAAPSVVAGPNDLTVAVGGIGVGDVASDSVWVADANGLTTLSTSVARVGSTVVMLDDRNALIIGGNVDAELSRVAAVVAIGADINDTQVNSLIADGFTDVPLFASATLLEPDAAGLPRVLLAGGNVINAGPAFPRDVAGARLGVVTVDLLNQRASFAPLEVANGDEPLLRRAAGQLTQVGDSVWWHGGYTAFTSSAPCDIASSQCFQSDLVSLSIAGTPPVATLETRSLDGGFGTLGMGLADLGDGAWLVHEGMGSITDSAIGRQGLLYRVRGSGDSLCP